MTRFKLSTWLIDALLCNNSYISRHGHKYLSCPEALLYLQPSLRKECNWPGSDRGWCRWSRCWTTPPTALLRWPAAKSRRTNHSEVNNLKFNKVDIWWHAELGSSPSPSGTRAGMSLSIQILWIFYSLKDHEPNIKLSFEFNKSLRYLNPIGQLQRCLDMSLIFNMQPIG